MTLTELITALINAGNNLLTEQDQRFIKAFCTYIYNRLPGNIRKSANLDKIFQAVITFDYGALSIPNFNAYQQAYLLAVRETPPENSSLFDVWFKIKVYLLNDRSIFLTTPAETRKRIDTQFNSNLRLLNTIPGGINFLAWASPGGQYLELGFNPIPTVTGGGNWHAAAGNPGTSGGAAVYEPEIKFPGGGDPAPVPGQISPAAIIGVLAALWLLK